MSWREKHWSEYTAEDRHQKERDSILAPNFNSGMVKRAQERMARVDAMPRETRELVYEFGLEIVWAFLEHKVTNPKSIRYLIETVRVEPYPDGGTRFAFNRPKNRPANILNEDDDTIEYTVIGKPTP